MDNNTQNEQHFPIFKFLSGGIKGLIESILFRIIGVERNAKLGLKK